MKVQYFVRKKCGMVLLAMLVLASKSLSGIIFDTVNPSSPHYNQAITVTWTPTFTSGGYAIGNVTFLKGFNLPDSGTVSLGITQGVNGTINLNNASLFLTNDMHASGFSFTITNGGYLYLNNYTIEVENGITIDNGIKQIVSPGNIIGLGQVPLYFTNGGAIAYSYISNGEVPVNIGTYQNINFINPTNANFALPDAPAGSNFVTFNNVTFYLASGVQLSPLIVEMNITGPVSIEGPGSTFEIGNTWGPAFVNFENDGSLYIGPDVTLITAGLIATFNETVNEIYFDNCTWNRNFESSPLTTGRMVFNGLVSIISPSTSPLLIGDGVNASNDFDLVLLPGATISVEPETQIIYQNIH